MRVEAAAVEIAAGIGLGVLGIAIALVIVGYGWPVAAVGLFCVGYVLGKRG